MLLFSTNLTRSCGAFGAGVWGWVERQDVCENADPLGVGFGTQCWVLRGDTPASEGVLSALRPGPSQSSLHLCLLGIVWWWLWWAGVWWCVECCIVDASILFCVLRVCGQVVRAHGGCLGTQEPMKDVGGRDKPRGAVNRAVIRGCPNGETQHRVKAASYPRLNEIGVWGTWGSETSSATHRKRKTIGVIP